MRLSFVLGASLLAFFIFLAFFAPILASNKPLIAIYEGTVYFPLARYLLFNHFYTKPIDLFFNAFLFSGPLFLLSKKKTLLLIAVCAHLILAAWAIQGGIKDPASDPLLNQQRQEWIQSGKPLTPSDDLLFLNKYAKLNIAVKEALAGQQPIELSYFIMPLVRSYHWEEPITVQKTTDHWWEKSRINHRDLVSGLIFGTRVSLMVGLLSVALSLLIGIPLGALAGYFGSIFDLLFCRFLELWEGCPVFFMLLFVTAITESKSVFLVIITLGIFNWTGFSRFVRAEVLQQKKLPYVDASRGMGFSSMQILFEQILPNSLSSVFSLLPFSIMGAVISEAGLSFLGLGEEGSCSWGTLMDEGRNAFPAESYLLWPPAILLALFLIAMALLGDALRDHLDPKTY
jgi:peptide/nickel transport system permease protein